jgi:DNA-binding NarL/FixJ family response regulator
VVAQVVGFIARGCGVHADPDLRLLEGSPTGAGYLLKERVADVTEFVGALEGVAAGGTALDPEVVGQLLRASRQAGGLAALTARERHVLAVLRYLGS